MERKRFCLNFLQVGWILDVAFMADTRQWLESVSRVNVCIGKCVFRRKVFKMSLSSQKTHLKMVYFLWMCENMHLGFVFLENN